MGETVDFAQLFGVLPEALPEECRKPISELDFRYWPVGGPYRDKVVLRVLETLASDLEMVGSYRKQRWESGWSQNLREFIESDYDLAALVPKFVRQNEIARLGGEYVWPLNPSFETSLVTVLRLYLFKTWFEKVDHVYEFGCGTAHNLVALARLSPDKALHGLDWATVSQSIIALLVERHGLNITSHEFDMFEPDAEFEIAPNSGVFTVGALEQLGRRHEPFLRFLLQKMPKICINVEVLGELYDEKKLLDYLVLRYLRKRGYLEGYLTRLRELEGVGRIRILQVQRTFGCLYHEGYSFVVWEPIW